VEQREKFGRILGKAAVREMLMLASDKLLLSKIFILILGGSMRGIAMQRAIWAPTQHLL